jgi:hypothetical protein
MDSQLKYVVPSINDKPEQEQRKWGLPGPECRFIKSTPEQMMKNLLIHCRTSYEQLRDIQSS